MPDEFLDVIAPRPAPAPPPSASDRARSVPSASSPRPARSTSGGSSCFHWVDGMPGRPVVDPAHCALWFNSAGSAGDHVRSTARTADEHVVWWPQRPVRAMKVARPEGLEPPTYGFEARRSIQLSYGRTETHIGFEPGGMLARSGAHHRVSDLPVFRRSRRPLRAGRVSTYVAPPRGTRPRRVSKRPIES